MPSKSAQADNTFGGPWSVAKLDCVENYLRSYLKVMANQSWSKLWYIDAFSGDGTQRFKTPDSADTPALFYDQDILDFTEGSAIRALRVSQSREERNQRGIDRFVFIEMSRAKIESLQAAVRTQFPRQYPRCTFVRGDVNTELPNTLGAIPWRQGGRAVCFIDPYATQTKWSTLEAFRGTASDVWYLFPTSALIRLLPRKKLPDPTNALRLDDFFGDSAWRSLYENPQASQLALFGDESNENLKREEGGSRLLRYTKERLSTIFPGVFGPGILKTPRNTPLFALFALVSNNSPAALGPARRIAESLIHAINDTEGRRP